MLITLLTYFIPFNRFQDFMNIVERHIQEEEPDGDVRQAFEAFDSQRTGFVSRADFRKVSEKMMTSKEVDEMLLKAEIDPNAQQIDYNKVLDKNREKW